MESEETKDHRLTVLLGGFLFLIFACVGIYRILTREDDALGRLIAIFSGLMSAVCFWAWRFGSAKAVKEISRGL